MLSIGSPAEAWVLLLRNTETQLSISDVSFRVLKTCRKLRASQVNEETGSGTWYSHDKAAIREENSTPCIWNRL